MEEIARVYGDALFDVAKEADKLDEVHEQLGQFVDALGENRELQIFLFSPYFSSAEKRDGIAKVIEDGNEELVAAARKDIETETRRSLEQIRKEVADLTVLATETLTKKSLSDADHQKLVEEALAEVDFGALAGDQTNGGSQS